MGRTRNAHRGSQDGQRARRASPRGRCDPRLARFHHSLDGPRVNILPTLMQLYPEHWFTVWDSPCYVIIGNWLDATEGDFVTKHNIQLIMKVAGVHPHKGEKPPPGTYGHNEHTGCQRKVEYCQINHRSIVCSQWLAMCDPAIKVWKSAKRGEPPPSVFIHCNEGVNRAPAWASLLASKLQGCQPSVAARALAKARDINPMYSKGKLGARGQDLTTWSLMHAVAEVLPLRVPFRSAPPGPFEYPMWHYVAMRERVFEYDPPASKVVLTPASKAMPKRSSAAFLDHRV